MAWIIAPVVLVVLVVLLGLRQVGEKERAAVELFGKFSRILKPGLNWILPGIMRIKKRVPTQELLLPLFEIPVKIDFSDGWAIPKSSHVWVVMKSPDDPYSVDGDKARSGAYRAIYEIEDWRKAIQARFENAVRTYLNRFTIDEAITIGKGGFNLANHDPDTGLPNPELEEIEKTLEGWGWMLKIVTVGDFDLDPKVIAARSKVHEEEKASEAASHLAKKRATETIGSVVRMMAESRGKKPEDMRVLIETDSGLQREFLDLSKDLVKRQMAIDGKSFVDIRVEGAQGIEKALLDLLAASKRMPMGSEESSTKESAEGEREKMREEKPTRSILSALASTLPKRNLDKEGARKLTEREKARLEEELNSLSKEEADRWHEWIMQMTARGYLKIE